VGAPTLLERLKKFSPQTFEQLAFDLATSIGLRNGVWRTPGADGGRDIEGDYVAVDMTGAVSVQRWYIECKRYAGSVDWPTVHNKVAYAQNHGADFLLLVTTGMLSPQCKSEVATHNARRAAPQIRMWDGTVLAEVVSSQAGLLVKYGLSAPHKSLVPAFVPLSLAVTRAIESAYGEASKGNASPSLEFSAAAAELLWVRVKEASAELPQHGTEIDKAVDMYDWTKLVPPCDLRGFDRYGFRAILTALRYVTRASTVTLMSDSSAARRLRATANGGRWPLSQNVVREIFGAFSLWSQAKIAFRDKTSITMEPEHVIT
jgi:hypothetical protein